MWFEESEGALIGVFDDPNRPANLRMGLDSLSGLRNSDLEPLLAATQKYLSPKKYPTQVALARGSLVKFGQYLREKEQSRLPAFNDIDGWQFIIFDWFAWYLLSSHETVGFQSRTKAWDTSAVLWLRGLVAEEYLPDGLIYPRARKKSRLGKKRSPRRPDFIGEYSATTTNNPIDKTLAGPLFWRSDSEYLDEIELVLRKRDNALRRVVDDYWLRLTKDYRAGKRLLRLVSMDEFREREELNHWTVHLADKINGKDTPVSSPDVERSASWALHILRSELCTSSSEYVFSNTSLVAHPGCRSGFLQKRFGTPIDPILDSTALTREQASLMDSRLLFMRFLGVLTLLDVTVAIIILIQEHPNLTPQAIANAKLVSPAGKSYVIATGEGRTVTFSVDKPRAGVRKYAQLTPRAARVMKHLIRATADARELLKRANHSHWRYLFLGCPAGPNSRIGLLSGVTVKNIVSSGKHRTLARFYPELEAAGIVLGVINFKRIRSTQAVLEWLKTGSLGLASRKIGNSYATAVQHYVPEPLIKIWNERIIRRFQNTLIVLAAADEDYLLDVADIESFSDLQSFLCQLLTENLPGSSPIADELHRRFSNSKLIGATEPPLPDSREYALLSVRLSPNSLAMLYAYRETALGRLSPHKLNQVDRKTGIAPNSFIRLATLFQHASEAQELSNILRESLDVARLREVNELAQRMQPDLNRKFRNLRIDPAWSDEF
ncbi:MAG: hypothetical protein AAGI27_04325 [Pseudomonadota bacterium]